MPTSLLADFADVFRPGEVVFNGYIIESTLSMSQPSRFTDGWILLAFFSESTMNLHFAGLKDKWLRRLHTPRESTYISL